MRVLRNIGLGAAQQALFTGQVINALTGAAVVPAAMTLEMRLPGQVEFRPLRVGLRFISAGYFCASGVAEQVLPQRLEGDAEVELRFRVSAPAYNDLEVVMAASAADITVETVMEDLGGHTLPLRLVAAPIVRRVLAMQPVPVGLRGRVISDHDFDAPLAGASIQVTEPELQAAVVSNTRGRFRIDALPVSQSVTLKVEQGGNSATIHHVIDYTTPFNTRIISLNG
ncbi:carboxypeptidase regulatory-like domain-containing protein [Nitrosomonas sp.]|uniref:carboxypeptidase regulatory-like domain-containing protein n=1 Tax=Nitrosomonas sp. TaxID=42353 RepID=UPI003305EF15